MLHSNNNNNNGNPNNKSEQEKNHYIQINDDGDCDDTTKSINNKCSSFNENTPLLNESELKFKLKRTNIYFPLSMLIFIFLFGSIIGIYLISTQNRFSISATFDLVERDVWGAREDIPRGQKLNHTMVRYVILMHTNSLTCDTFSKCVKLMKEMQYRANLTDNSDIPFNFLIGGDGQVYEARGWSHQSSILEIPKNSSLTVAFVGNFTRKPPTTKQLNEAQSLIFESIRRNKLRTDYSIFGLRHYSNLLPKDGDALFQSIISSWPRWEDYINVIIE